MKLSYKYQEVETETVVMEMAQGSLTISSSSLVNTCTHNNNKQQTINKNLDK